MHKEKVQKVERNPEDVCKSDRSRQELFKLYPNSKEYLVAKLGFDAAETESFKDL